MTYFLLEHDRRTRETVVDAFADRTAALEELKVRERERTPEVEVVLLIAESLDDIKRTHSRYWPFDIARELAVLSA